VIGSHRVTWCNLIWGIYRFTGRWSLVTGQYVVILTDRHIDRSEWSW